jgi:phage/plasmid-associated DNA primase
MEHEHILNELINEPEASVEKLQRITCKRLYPYYRNYKIYKNKRVWFEFTDHTWNINETGIHNALLDCIVYAIDKAIDICKENDEDTKIETLCKMKMLFYEKIVNKEKSLADLFYDDTFVQHLDTKRELIPFVNGVLDTANEEFRDGHPDDMLYLQSECVFKLNDPFLSSKIENFQEFRDNTNLLKMIKEITSDSKK